MNKLIIVIMGPGKKHFAEMCLDSVKDASDILYWTNSNKIKKWDDWSIAEEYAEMKKEGSIGMLYGARIFDNKWNESDKVTNGKCRNKYLKHLKENYPDDWCLVLDEDEILEEGGIEKIKKFINEREPGIYNVKMRHFIGDIGHEDNTRQVHVVPGRLFKISETIKYPEHSHPILEGELMGACLDTTIWHLGHLPVEYMNYILKRYKQHSNDSVIHNQDFLKQWKFSHLFGHYPKREINPVELPKQILDRYELDRDEFYFASRQNLEVKHFIDVINWKEFFNNPTIIEFGCGVGQRIFALHRIGMKGLGIELSEYAVRNSLEPNAIIRGDVLNYDDDIDYDLVVAYDLLEHIDYAEIESAITNIISHSKKYILISVPTLGDPNLEADPTHKIKEDKEWWVEQFINKGCVLIPTPEHFLYKEQIMIFEVPK